MNYKLMKYSMPFTNSMYAQASKLCQDLELDPVEVDEKKENDFMNRFFGNGFMFARVVKRDGELEVLLTSQSASIKAMSSFNTLFGDYTPDSQEVPLGVILEEENFAQIGSYINVN